MPNTLGALKTKMISTWWRSDKANNAKQLRNAERFTGIVTKKSYNRDNPSDPEDPKTISGEFEIIGMFLVPTDDSLPIVPVDNVSQIKVIDVKTKAKATSFEDHFFED